MKSYLAAGALTASVVLTACTGSGTAAESTTTSEPSTVGQASVPPLDCGQPSKTDVIGQPVVPSGAVAARLCGGLVDNGGFDMAWPADTLRGSRVARLVDRLNRLEPYRRPRVCETVLSPGFGLVLAYPDGSRVRLDGDTSGNCANVAVRGGQVWTGAGGVLHGTLALIESRRRALGPTATNGDDSVCPRHWRDVTYTAGAGAVSPRDQVIVGACRYRLDRPAPGTITQSADGRLTGQVRLRDPGPVLREVVTGSRVDPCGGVAYDLARTQDVLLVRDGYGDTQVVSTAPCWANRLSGQRRYASSTLASRVAALLSSG